ncbi:hypothetical protein KKG81_11975 [bacterium]|nr:hypothetical protein [bacterium]
MPYLVSSIIAVVSAMVIMFTRYEADDSTITAELDRMKSMFVSVDGFVNTYVESGGDLTIVNFEELYDAGILLGNIRQSAVGATDKELDSDGSGFASTLTFPGSTVIWQLIPNKDDSSSYKVLVDMTKNSTLLSKGTFAESFSGREYCEKILFGTFQTKGKTYDATAGSEDFKEDGTNKDGFFVCIVYK